MDIDDAFSPVSPKAYDQDAATVIHLMVAEEAFY
jgi:hypothetical protein